MGVDPGGTSMHDVPTFLSPWTCASKVTSPDQRRPIGAAEAYLEVKEQMFLDLRSGKAGPL